MKLLPILPEYETSGLEEDFEKSVKIERWRVGEAAFYQPAGFGKYAYLPLTEVLTAYPHDFRVKGGCSCAGTIPSGGVAILLEALKERIPDLDMTVPEIYKNRTRDPM